MNSTKYQLLKDDYDFVCKQLKESRQMVDQLRKAKEQAYHDGYKQGRYDEKINQLNS